MRWLPLTLLCACHFDASVAPGAVIVRCADDTQCPPRYRCEASVSLCWSVNADGVAPSVSSFSLPVHLAGRGTSLPLTLTASEALIIAPHVALRDDTGHEVGTFSAVSGTAPPTYAFQHLAGGNDPEGVLDVEANLTDLSGTVAPPAILGQVTFDFTPPAVTSASLEYDAPTGTVTALSATGTARLTVRLSEATGEPPTLTDEGHRLVAMWAGGSGNVHQFNVRAAPGVDFSGPVTAVAHVVDAVGNAADVPVPLEIFVDTVAPTAPQTQLDGVVLYRRSPRGTTVSPQPTFEVSGQTGAVEGAGTVVVSAPTLGLELGRGTSHATGSFGPIALPAVDVAQVAVQFIDSAGNRSPIAQVLDTEWTASPRADLFTSPHQLESESFATDRWAPRSVVPLQADDGAQVDSRLLRVSGGAAWRAHAIGSGFATLVPTGSPLVSAPALGGLFAFVGAQPLLRGSASTLDTAEWLPQTMSDPEGDGDPVGISAVAYDEARRAVTAFAGGATWRLTGQSWQRVDSTSPACDAMTFDPDLGQLVLAGPTGLAALVGNHWVPTGPPGPLTARALSYDRARRQLLLVQGDGTFLALPADARQAWRRLPPVPGLGPSSAQVAWDDETRRLIATCTSSDPKVSYAWDGNSWRALSPSATPVCGPLAFEPRSRHVVLVQASALSTLVGDGWHIAPPATASLGMSANSLHVAIPLGAEVAVFGGQSTSTATFLFDGVHWRVGGPAFPVRPQGGGATEIPGGMMLGGGIDPVTALPSPRVYVSSDLDAGFALSRFSAPRRFRFVYEPLRQAVLALGASPPQLWEVGTDPDAGGSPSTAAPPATMAYDRRGFMVGVFPDGTTRTLAPGDSQWADAGSALSATPLDLATEPWTGKAVAVTTDGHPLVFEPQGWVPLDLGDPFGNQWPEPRVNTPLAIHRGLQALMLFGGRRAGTGTDLSDTWELRLVGGHPGVVLRADLEAAGFPAGTVFQQLEAHVVAGADGWDETSGVARPGVEVQLWQPLGWTSIGTNASTAAAVSSITAQTAGLDLQRTLVGTDRLSLRVVSVGATRATPARVALDAIDVTVRARLPGP